MDNNSVSKHIQAGLVIYWNLQNIHRSNNVKRLNNWPTITFKFLIIDQQLWEQWRLCFLTWRWRKSWTNISTPVKWKRPFRWRSIGFPAKRFPRRGRWRRRWRGGRTRQTTWSLESESSQRCWVWISWQWLPSVLRTVDDEQLPIFVDHWGSVQSKWLRCRCRHFPKVGVLVQVCFRIRNLKYLIY